MTETINGVPLELLKRAVQIPSKASVEENHAAIVDRGRAQAELRDMLSSLPAGAVSADNCDLLRARIAELERGYTDTEIELAGENFRLRAELAAIKAQEPAFMWHKGATEDESEVVDVDCACPCCVPLYAAPVSEAKAQGVVQWPNADEIMQMAFEEGQPADDASGYYFELEEFDLFIERLMSEVASLNASPVQQVSVPASAFASRAITHYEAALLAAFPSGSSGEVFNQWNEARRVLNAAPAAPSQGEQVRVVPVEPTEAMRKAAQDKLASEGLIVTDWLIHTAYSAMLNAAPVSAGDDEFCDGNCTWLDHHPSCARAAAPAAPAADAGLVEALDYQVLFDAIAAATSVYANGAVNISVQAFRDALAAHRAKGVV